MTISLMILQAGISFSETSDSSKLNDATPAMISRSVLSGGDTARLERVMAKARRGEKIVVGTIGGSITEGAAASTPERRWANLAAQWWITHFPNTKVEFVNAGIGATGSNIGAHRAKEHLLKFNPDVVIMEYAVNDPNDKLAAETLEGMVRQTLKMPNKPAVMLLFTMNPQGANAQEWHSKIGYHYGLPMISYRDGLYPEFESGAIKWESIMPDGIHPNDQGMKYIGQYIGSFLDGVLANLPADKKLPRIKRMPKPFISDVFEYTEMLNSDSIMPVANKGWTPANVYRFGNCWETTTPGSELDFDVEGDTISLVFFRIKGDKGIAEAQVDDTPAVKMNAWFDADWGGYSCWELIARNLGPGKHRLKIKVLHENATQSNGHKFQLQSIMEAGIKHK
ncbi:MAG: SGNH/GDSL hydrolase family protein [Armatimonadota bacterium]